MDSRKESVILYASTISVINSPVSSPILMERLIDASNYVSDKGSNFIHVNRALLSSPISDDNCENKTCSVGKLKRGRPKLETISNLIASDDDSAIKCNVCKRSFPREKSLQAHLRIHTGERPYLCDFPDCGRRFAQSGQLRTHQRLHTGEKPFVCKREGCGNRFTHANRHCPIHPKDGVIRDREGALQGILTANNSLNNLSQEIIDWLAAHTKSDRKGNATKRSKSKDNERLRSRKLNLEIDVVDSGGSENSVPIWKKKRAALELLAKRKKIKKEIPEASIDDEAIEVCESDPIEYEINEIQIESRNEGIKYEIPSEMDSEINFELNGEINSDLSEFGSEITKDKLLGALALMELANSPVVDVRSESDILNDPIMNYFDSGFSEVTLGYHGEELQTYNLQSSESDIN